jgi:hypothetical protein
MSYIEIPFYNFRTEIASSGKGGAEASPTLAAANAFGFPFALPH